ncbi:hypothetical protein LTR05_000094 [Lithohypha guttulata]|uniref:Uncharacterized protein n=1 Tax=Lithohypha guttulata TaxID=1690604 RepID=A0AAN7YK13_9EURO|nr:hypothetical protein LTR05_000094 [Lithohypha guttulata]
MKNAGYLALSVIFSSALAVPITNGTVRFNVAKLDGSRVGRSDVNILTFALALEYLETAFYTEAVEKFSAADFEDPSLYDDLVRLARDEQVHVDVLSQTLQQLRQDVPAPCQYSFPYDSPPGFITLASIIEGVGVSAYAGASTSIRNPNVLSMAAAILPVEARHDAILRLAAGIAPYASPFDVPLDFNQAWSLASQFIVPGSYPAGYAGLRLTAFPPLALVAKDNTTAGPVQAGDTITLKADMSLQKEGASLSLKADLSLSHSAKARHFEHRRHVPLHQRSHERRARRDRTVYAAFVTAMGAIVMEVEVKGNTVTTTVPEGIAGQVYVVLTTNSRNFHDRYTIAGPAIIEVEDQLTVEGSTAEEE